MFSLVNAILPLTAAAAADSNLSAAMAQMTTAIVIKHNNRRRVGVLFIFLELTIRWAAIVFVRRETGLPGWAIV